MEHWNPWQRMVLLGIFTAIMWFVAHRVISAIYGHTANARADRLLNAADEGPRVLLWIGLIVVWAVGSWLIVRSGHRSGT